MSLIARCYPLSIVSMSGPARSKTQQTLDTFPTKENEKEGETVSGIEPVFADSFLGLLLLIQLRFQGRVGRAELRSRVSDLSDLK